MDPAVPPADPQPTPSAMRRALRRAADGLTLDVTEAAVLLDLGLRSYRRWKADGPGRLGRDGKARLSNLMGIHKGLRLIFGDSPRVYAWINAPNAAFGGMSALDVMLRGELTDLIRVRRYIDAERGGW